MLKLQFEVTGPKGFRLRREKTNKFEPYKPGDRFIAFAYEVPESFRDTVKVIGPAPQPSVDVVVDEVGMDELSNREEVKEDASPKPTIKPRRVVRKK